MGLGKSLKKVGHHVKKACGKVSNPIKKGIKKCGIAKYTKSVSNIFSGKLSKSFLKNYIKNSIGERLSCGNTSDYGFMNRYFSDNIIRKFSTYC